MRPEDGAPGGDACHLTCPHRSVFDALRANAADQVETDSKPSELSMPEQSVGAPQSVAESAQQLPPASRNYIEPCCAGSAITARPIAMNCSRLLPRSASTSTTRSTNWPPQTSCNRTRWTDRDRLPILWPTTGHTVHLIGHPPVAAMCAIDALGIPLMTGTDGVIDPRPPHRDTYTAFNEAAVSGGGNPDIWRSQTFVSEMARRYDGHR